MTQCVLALGKGQRHLDGAVTCHLPVGAPRMSLCEGHAYSLALDGKEVKTVVGLGRWDYGHILISSL